LEQFGGITRWSRSLVHLDHICRSDLIHPSDLVGLEWRSCPLTFVELYSCPLPPTPTLPPHPAALYCTFVYIECLVSVKMSTKTSLLFVTLKRTSNFSLCVTSHLSVCVPVTSHLCVCDVTSVCVCDVTLFWVCHVDCKHLCCQFPYR